LIICSQHDLRFAAGILMVVDHILIIAFNWLDNQIKCNNQDVTQTPQSPPLFIQK